MNSKENTESTDGQPLDEDLSAEVKLDEDIDDEDIEIIACDEEGKELDQEESAGSEASEAQEAREEYLRLYAEFDNYKKRVARDRETAARFANESIIMDLLPTLDHLEIALKHSRNNEDPEAPKDGLAEGVEMTLRELLRTLEKHGVKQIEAEGKAFDPEFHHAVSQVESDDMDEGMVVEDLRKGYIYNSKVIRASMVSVSKAVTETAGNDE